MAHLLRANTARLEAAEAADDEDDLEEGEGCPCPVPGVVVRLGCPEHGSPGG